MKAKLSKSRPIETISGYVEHLGGRGTPKCSINDPMHKTRSWILGAGQRTPVIQVPKGHSMLAWIATKDYLRFVATRTMGSRGKVDPLPSAPPTVKAKPKPAQGGGSIVSMGDTMPGRTPKQMMEGTPLEHPPVVPDAPVATVEPRRPDLSPKALLEGSAALMGATADEDEESADESAEEPADDSAPLVPEPEAVEPASLLARLEALDYKSLKALADRYEVEYAGRSAKAIINAILLYAESLPEDAQLAF